MAVLLRFDDSVDTDHPLYARYASVAPGSPGSCPTCDAAGAVDSVEPATRVQNQCCSSCGFRWQYRFGPDGRISEVRELAGRRLDLLAPAPEQIGTILDLRDESADAEPAGRSWWRRRTVT